MTPAAAYAPTDIDIPKEVLDPLKKKMNKVRRNIRGASKMNFDALAGADIHAQKRGWMPAFLATGGMARGTDTVPAMLTPGEFVMKKSAVDKYGVGFMRSLNNGASPTSRSRGVQYLQEWRFCGGWWRKPLCRGRRYCFFN